LPLTLTLPLSTRCPEELVTLIVLNDATELEAKSTVIVSGWETHEGH
jgi:hypothetical protein